MLPPEPIPDPEEVAVTRRNSTLLFLFGLFAGGHDTFQATRTCVNSSVHRHDKMVVFYRDYPHDVIGIYYFIESGRWSCLHCKPILLDMTSAVLISNGVAAFVNGECIYNNYFYHGSVLSPP